MGCFITGKKEFLFNWFRLFSGKGITNYSKIYDLLRFVGVFSMTKFAQRHFRDRISGRWQLFIRSKWFVLFSSEWLALLEVIIYFLNKQSNYDKKKCLLLFFHLSRIFSPSPSSPLSMQATPVTAPYIWNLAHTSYDVLKLFKLV